MIAATDQLVAALAARADGPMVVRAARGRPWCSATFAGHRHAIALSLDPAAAARLVDGLEEAELPLRGHVVVDIVAVAEPGGVRIEALTIIDAPAPRAPARARVRAASERRVPA